MDHDEPFAEALACGANDRKAASPKRVAVLLKNWNSRRIGVTPFCAVLLGGWSSTSRKNSLGAPYLCTAVTLLMLIRAMMPQPLSLVSPRFTQTCWRLGHHVALCGSAAFDPLLDMIPKSGIGGACGFANLFVPPHRYPESNAALSSSLKV